MSTAQNTSLLDLTYYNTNEYTVSKIQMKLTPPKRFELIKVNLNENLKKKIFR